jgi:hypothetical protein
MKKSAYRLSDEKMKIIAVKIGKPIHKQFIKILEKEINKIPNCKEINLSDFINIILITLNYVDVSTMDYIQGMYKRVTNQDIDYDKLINSYISNLIIVMDGFRKNQMN